MTCSTSRADALRELMRARGPRAGIPSDQVDGDMSGKAPMSFRAISGLRTTAVRQVVRAPDGERFRSRVPRHTTGNSAVLVGLAGKSVGFGCRAATSLWSVSDRPLPSVVCERGSCVPIEHSRRADIHLSIAICYAAPRQSRSSRRTGGRRDASPALALGFFSTNALCSAASRTFGASGCLAFLLRTRRTWEVFPSTVGTTSLRDSR